MAAKGPDKPSKSGDLANFTFKDILNMDAAAWRKQIAKQGGIKEIKERLSVYGTYETNKLADLQERFDTLFSKNPRILSLLKNTLPAKVDEISYATYTQIL